MKFSAEEERSEHADLHATNGPPIVPQLNLSSLYDQSWLPPVHVNTVREMREVLTNADSGSQTARVRFAPPPRSKLKPSQSCRRPSRSRSTIPFQGLSTDLHQKQLNTARCFETLENWQQSIDASVLKSLLVGVQEALHTAIYHESKPDFRVESESSSSIDYASKSKTAEYFSLVADMQEKAERQRQERKRLATQLSMEKSLGSDLSMQLQNLEGELTQLQLRHAYHRAEIEGERRAVQALEEEYASLIDQEVELKRDCEVFELQLETQQAHLREIRSQHLYLDFVSNAPLKRHLEEKKWQEQHASVALQAQNAEAENRELENEIRKLEDETCSLEAQYAREIQTKQQTETSLCELQANYEQFQDAFERTRTCYTPRPDWDRIVDETPELSVQKYQFGMVENASTDDDPGVMNSDTNKDKAGVLERLDSMYNIAIKDDDQQSNGGRTKTLVKEMLHWIERLQKHCGVNLHLSRIWHDVEEARVELNILHHQLDRAVRKNSMLPNIFPNDSGVITIAATSPRSGSPSKRRTEYIMALGTHEAVPLFLRHRGKLKRRVLKKIDVEKVVRKVWVEKRKREQRNPLGRYSLEKILYEKLHRKYGFKPLIAEWGYNLLLALQLFSWDSEIDMFLLCLTGAVSDLVYVDQEQMIQGCQQLLLRLCELYSVESFVTERRVLLKDALVTVRTYFPLKTAAQLQAIEQSIIRDMHKMKRGGNDSILYIDDILPLGVKYPLGFFVKTIRTQHFKEIQDYYALLLSELEQRDTEQRGILPISAVRDAILAIDPLADSGAVQNLIVKALNIKTQVHLHLREPVLYKAILRKMNATCLMKFALNFDQNAEVNWRRRAGVVYTDSSTTNTEI